MITRRLLAVAALAASLATLTSCTDSGSAAAPSDGAATSASAAVTGVPGAPRPSGSASRAEDLPVDPEPTFDCTAPKVPAGHRMVRVTGAPSGGAVPVRVAQFVCGPSGGAYDGTGKAGSYPLADGATGELSTGATGHRTVTASELTGHLAACLRHAPVKAPYSCSGDIYEITLGPAGAVTHLREVWHS
ncbi:hypothetical protein OG422_23010 [Streptomyces sp. NBC_01525]|uniref:hypothetical protein n=1 Tax=Streptomyces sp. NBC_01525 TaxID=2903893 RepID=UPI0038695595